MKKYVFIIILFSICLTGCFGNAGKGELETTCKRTIETNYITEENIYVLTYKEGNIKKVKLSKTYAGLNLASSMNTYKKAYENESGVEIETTDNSINMTFDMDLVSDNIKDTFSLKNTYNEQVKLLEDKGFTCE